RVVVTGLGALTPVGNTVDEFWSALTQGKSGIGPITKFDAQTKTANGEYQFVTRIAGEVRNFDELKYIDKKDARRYDPYLKYALGDAFRLIQRGDADVMIAGGAEAIVVPLTIAGFCSMKAMSTRNDEPEKASRPFDAGRDGFVCGEGGGVLVLESLEHARRR